MNKKGFTLIELLAVIVILAIIAVIAIPIVLNMISDLRKDSTEISMKNIEKAASLYFQQNRKDENIVFECSKDKCKYNNKKLELSGKSPESGKILIDKKGNITYEDIVLNGFNCYKEHDKFVCDPKKIRKVYNESKIVLNSDKEYNLFDYNIYGNSVQDEDDVQEKILPEEYAQLEYIESTGTQIIDTNIYLKSEYDIEFKFSTSSFTTSETTSQNLFTSNDKSKDKNWHYSCNLGDAINESNIYGWKYYAASYTAVVKRNLAINTDYVIKTLGNDWYINELKFSASNSMESGKTSPIPLKLFGGETPFDAGNLKIYYFKVFNGEELVADFVPVSKGEEVGMYDTVNGEFYTNLGPDKFLKGRNLDSKKSVGDYDSETKKYKIPVTAYVNEFNNNYEYDVLIHPQNNWGNIQLQLKPNTKYNISCTSNSRSRYVVLSIDMLHSNDNPSSAKLWLSHVTQDNINLFPDTPRTFTTTDTGIVYIACNYFSNMANVKKYLTEVFNNSLVIKEAESTTNIYLDEPLRKFEDKADYIDFKNGKVVRYIEEDSMGNLTVLSVPKEEKIELPEILLHKGINNIEIESNIKPTKIELEYYK